VQRRLVALAPLLAGALLLHVGLVCRAPLAIAAPPTVTAPAPAPADAAPARTDAAPGPAGTVRTDAAPPVDPTSGPAPAAPDGTERPVAAAPDGTERPVAALPRPGRAGWVTLRAYRVVSTLAATDGPPPGPTLMISFDGQVYGSVARSIRGKQTTDRRSPLPAAEPTLPDGTVRRDAPPDDRPGTVGAGHRPLRLTVLRC
jgi:hypothetical protein